MKHLTALATAAMEADKAYSAAHHAAYTATDISERVRLDLIKRRALDAYVTAKLAYERALDAYSADTMRQAAE